MAIIGKQVDGPCLYAIDLFPKDIKDFNVALMSVLQNGNLCRCVIYLN